MMGFLQNGGVNIIFCYRDPQGINIKYSYWDPQKTRLSPE